MVRYQIMDFHTLLALFLSFCSVNSIYIRFRRLLYILSAAYFVIVDTETNTQYRLRESL